MDQSSIIQNRRSRRSNVLLTATLATPEAEVSVKLRNLSSEGALVQGAPLPEKGSNVRFNRNELSVGGRIAWVDGKLAGVAFDRPLAQDQVLRHVPGPRQIIHPKFRRPGLASELSPEERRLVESWVWTKAPARPGE